MSMGSRSMSCAPAGTLVVICPRNILHFISLSQVGHASWLLVKNEKVHTLYRSHNATPKATRDTSDYHRHRPLESAKLVG
jgi:hypothetical protein